ncbi:3-methylcrotonyl-CoA carboxylase beta subunit [Fistulifera solaris]|uniref:methylcrotonoyl-CoA carboxylase n=1 Tax=Fistulifera solaris TaxID=1519565 RepID=A0A1Z5K9V2_FISSO|nr:3-methylcrotonyl-CoA carboxylase beta subunit [Fistulifera solaris]|eukprot:GAX23039.1 3-methylcrotonyl-CoA carboxylase beta subunit [Fistulifera solaris]
MMTLLSQASHCSLRMNRPYAFMIRSRTKASSSFFFSTLVKGCGSLLPHTTNSYHHCRYFSSLIPPHHLAPPLLDDTDITQTQSFQESVQHVRAQVDLHNQRYESVRQGGGASAVQRHQERHKKLPRERIDLLVDPGTPVLELSPLAGTDWLDGTATTKHHIPSGGIVTAIGMVAGTPCMIVANDATVKGGTYFPITVKKHLRAQEIALQNQLPCIYLVDSGGAFLPQQDQVFPDRDHFGRIFYHQSIMSAQNIPQIAAVCGSCTAGGAYVPSLCDETIMVRGNGTVFLGGPPLVRAATGEVVTAQDLGGADVHATRSGVTDHVVNTEEEAMAKLRHIVSFLGPQQRMLQPPLSSSYEEPLYNVQELEGLVPTDSTKQPMDARKILARILDGSRFHEFKKEYGTTLVTGFGKIMGQDVGILANNGILFSESSLKGAHFVQLCCQRGIPILFLQNITGFMVGQKYEHEGIAKHGAKLVSAVSNATVPKITLIVAGSFGAGNYGMCGRAFSPRFLFMWPTARIGVMGGAQAAKVLSTVQRDNKERNGETWTEEEEKAFEQPILDQFEKQSSAYYSTRHLWDDGIIAPAETRFVLGNALAIARRVGCDPPNATQFGVFRM